MKRKIIYEEELLPLIKEMDCEIVEIGRTMGSFEKAALLRSWNSIAGRIMMRIREVEVEE